VESLESMDRLNLKGKADFELPYYSKYLMIASYLASYNPPQNDIRLFSSKTSSTKQKNHSRSSKTAKATQLNSGARAFPIDRMLAIFFSIVNENVTSTVIIYSQISSLVTLNLLTQVSATGNIDNTKLKCNVSREFIESISKQLKFPLENFSSTED